MFNDFFYDRLIQLRLQKDVSAREMSLALGKCSTYINHMENKKLLPSMTVFFEICEYFRISPKEFFDTESKYPAKMDGILADMKTLNPEQLDIIAALVKSMKK